MTCPSTQCLFCPNLLSRPRKAREHMEKRLIFYRLGNPIPRPYPACQEDQVVFVGHVHSGTTSLMFNALESPVIVF
jgi:hypothetical protein